MAEAPDLPEPDRRGDLAHPRETMDLLGQDAAEHSFLDALNKGRLHHAWLLQGPEGIGKATLAYRIARYMLAYGDKPTDSLDVPADHRVVRQINARSAADLLVLNRPYNFKDKKLYTEINVDAVARAAEFFSKTASDGGFRIVILDSAEELNRHSANKLLKTLEEPPERGLFLIVSHAPGRLLPTIRSRCRTLALKPLSRDTVAHLVRRHLADVAEDDLDLLVDLSEGSAGKALSLANDKALNLYRDMSALLGALPKLDAQALHSFADKFARSGDDGGQFRLIGDLLAQWILRTTRAGAIEGRGGLDRWVEVWDKAARLFERTEAVNLQRKQVLLDVFLSLAQAARGA